MQKRHLNPKQYFDEQALSTQKYVLPFIEQIRKISPLHHVLEIGCGEAGNLKPFLDLGCECTGVDFSSPKIEKGKAFYASHPNVKNLHLISEDIYKTNDFLHRFDVIIIRDVIEHIHDQDKFLGLLGNLMAVNAIVFFAFPPWQNPFGGHQQICENKYLSALPYFHLLPRGIYKSILKTGGESNGKISSLLEIKETGISIERFEKLIFKNNFQIKQKTLYFINPGYEVKFGLKSRKLTKLIGLIPILRNFFCTSGYYLIQKK